MNSKSTKSGIIMREIGLLYFPNIIETWDKAP